jgi:hypothetical protein
MENRFEKVAGLILLSLVFSCCQKVELRGLVHSYESADERFNLSMNWNLEHPFREIKVPNDDYSIYVMGDSHVGGTKNLDLFLTKAKKMNPAATVMDGDLTDGHAESYEHFQQHLQAQDSLLTYQIAGNHDLYFEGWKKFYNCFGSSTYLFSVKTPDSSDLYICIDSGSGTLGRKQIDWLKDILGTERSNYRHCVIFTHINLFRIRHTLSANFSIEELHVL